MFLLDFVGAMILDYQGLFVDAARRYLHRVASASIAETMATRQGLPLASRVGCNNIIAEGDSLGTTNACNG
jgi:hypothetical protein